jgi:hypothetical protein
MKLSASAPTTGDDSADGYSIGWLWVNTTNGDTYVCIDATVASADWIQINGGGGGGGGGTVDAIVGSADINVDSTDPANPELSIIADRFVRALVAGTNITIDNTDPENPEISASGGGSSDALGYSLVDIAAQKTRGNLSSTNYSRGVTFSITGARFYSQSATSRTLRLRIYDAATTTSVKNQDFVVAATGIIDLTFTTAYTPASGDIGKTLVISLWDTVNSGSSILCAFVSNTNWGGTEALPPKDSLVPPGILYRNFGRYGFSGDVCPVSDDAGNNYALEPKFT